MSDLDAYRNKLAENTLYLNGMLETVNGGEEDINKKKFTRLDVKTYDLEFDKDGKTKATKPKTKTILDLKKEKVGFAPELMHRLKDAVTFIPVNTDSDFTPMAVQPKDKVQALG